MLYHPQYRWTGKFLVPLVCILLAQAVFLVPLSTSTTAGETIRWHIYKEGMALARHLNKKILINFHADWCSSCKKMDRETFKNSAVLDYLNANFVAIKVDSDLESDIADLYNVKGLPATWFVAETGEKISNLPGFVPPDVFINILKYVKSDSYQSMSFKDFLKNL